ncbi:beta-ketoacyl synthase N-terminal-like domain-containing protein [Lentzea aerocolonigenes]|uniref:beta-ketoacyl synthase N-terminal-like domain-containing protein n=1 Tax=Lentzea aerocolonigenes TaxID=68170 RepID=UPI0004C2DE99|nr:beta-ketoacyl synthase N-terminal-like domain-containing protein [Lentzea aerocolonigenes]MCP2242205.1 3-oxoacyl-[acyl-carrier-protein] synthase II [Lentzea aerocolonigenes]
MNDTTAVVTGWSVVSPFGFGAKSYVDGVLGGDIAARPVDAGEVVLPDALACTVRGLDPAAILDGKGIRHLDRASQLALATLSELVEPGLDTGERAGLVLGTALGSVQTEMDHMRASLRARRPHLLDPKTLASGTMNCAAAQCAIRFGITGPNTTVAGGRAAGLHALDYASRLLAAGRADRVIAGAVEEYTPARAWLTHHACSRRLEWLGEGSAMFRLEAPGAREPLAHVLAVTGRVAVDRDLPAAVVACARDVLDRAGVGAAAVWAAIDAGSSLRERAALAGLVGLDALTRVPGAEGIGDTGAASAAFAVATALGLVGRWPEAAGRNVLVMATDPNGAVSGALLRLGGA